MGALVLALRQRDPVGLQSGDVKAGEWTVRGGDETQDSGEPGTTASEPASPTNAHENASAEQRVHAAAVIDGDTNNVGGSAAPPPSSSNDGQSAGDASSHERCAVRFGGDESWRPAEFPATTDAVVAGFYHMVQIGDWQEISQEQLGSVEASGLLAKSASVTISLAGAPQDQQRLGTWLGDQVVTNSEWSKVATSTFKYPMEMEYPTLDRLHAYCKRNPKHYVWYAHAKGLNREAGVDMNVRAGRQRYWRWYMMHYVVERWADCLAQLHVHGKVTCGADFVGYGPQTGLLPQGDFPHYSGNFWWASCSHVATLPAPSAFRDGPHPQAVSPYKEQEEYMSRMYAEFWLCSRGDRSRMANCFEKRGDYYAMDIAPLLYGCDTTLCAGDAPAPPSKTQP